MNESKAMESVDRNQPEPVTPNLAKRMDQLYDQSEAVKMVSLKAFMDLGRQDEGASEAAVTKLSQMVLKAIESSRAISGPESSLLSSRSTSRSRSLSGSTSVVAEGVPLGAALGSNAASSLWA